MPTPKIETPKVYFDVYQKDLKKRILVAVKAKCVRHNGRLYKLFRVGTLAKVLCRSVTWIQSWHKDGKVPECLYYIEGDKSRWYSEDQIRMMEFFQRTVLGDDPTKIRGPGHNTEHFFALVRENWDIVNFDPNDFEIKTEFVETGKGSRIVL